MRAGTPTFMKLKCACGGLVAVVALTAVLSAGRNAWCEEPSKPAHPFRKNVKVEVTDELLIVKSDGIPDHDTGPFPNRNNPNTIQKQNYTFKIPRKPVRANTITKLPMGPIGVAINGVPFYNPYNAEGQDAAKTEVFDDCCGHPDPRGRYHYHIYPTCIYTPFKRDEAGKHSDLLGYAFDGYAIYGPNGENGKPPGDLDECNGHEDKDRGYHYHVTNKFPYILGGYRGVVAKANLDRPGMGRPPGGPGPGGGRPPRGN
jgi:hypothetical protein